MFTSEEADYALAYLDRLFPEFDRCCKMATDDEVLGSVAEHSDKSAGYPWETMGAPLKGVALKKFGIVQLEDYYRDNVSVVSSTLKDELRPVGKDARLFRPQDVSSYLEGVRLFKHQNDYLMRTHQSPIFNQFVTPGPDLSVLYQRLQQFSPECYAADGARWDARYPLAIASLVCKFRERVAPERVRRYYQMMYNGYTNWSGYLVNFVGQPSGHHNTSTDNSIGHIIAMAIHACRAGLSLEEFEQAVLFYCCGDDLIWSSRSEDFVPRKLDVTYVSLGMHLEYEFLDPHSVFDLTFVGTQPVKVECNGVRVVLSTLITQRSLASLHIDRVKAKPLDLLMRDASLAILCFADRAKYTDIVQRFHKHLDKFVESGLLDADAPEVRGMEAAICERALWRAYTHWE